MKTDKTKLLQDIEAMKEKLASMEEELNKSEEFKHFPSKGDEYYFYTSLTGNICSKIAYADGLRVNVYKSVKEAQEAYNKAVAIEKVKRRIMELQGDWKPDWGNVDEKKFCIMHDHSERRFMPISWFITQNCETIPFMKNEEITRIIIEEMEDELKLIFDIQQIYFDKIEERNR